MAFRPDVPETPLVSADLHVSAEQYRAYANVLQELVTFMHQGGHWDQLDPASLEQHRGTLTALKKAQAKDYPDLSLGQAAEALIQRFDGKAETFRTAKLLSEGDTVVVPKLGNGEWEVVKVDQRSKTYFLANPRDRRSANDIVNAVLSGETRDGEPVGHEVAWDELEQLAA